MLRSTETFLPEDKAFVKFYLLSPNTPSLMIKANEEKINNTTSGSNGVFPSTITFPDYAAIIPNSVIKLAIPNLGTRNDSVVLFTNKLTLEAKKFYSLTLADTGIDRTLFTILDENTNPLPADSFYNIRLINAMAKSPNLSLIRVDSTTSTSFIRDTIATDIAFKTASKLVAVPVYSKRITGTTSSFHSFVRYRLFVTTTGVSIGNLVTPAQSIAINQRNTSIYAVGFLNGTGNLIPQLTNIVYNK